MLLIKRKITFFAVNMMLLFCAGLLTGTCPKDSNANIPAPVKSILFVGNSLTYTNDLPAIVTSLAKQKGIEVTATTLAKPNYALEDHWIDGEMQQLIRDNKYDFVIIQQGPSSQAEGREMLLDYGQRIKDLCNTRGMKLVFFMVWPARANLHMFDGVIKNYTDAATATGSLLCPVGTEWKKYFAETKDYSYYGADSFHPSQKGSEAAAAVIVKTLF